MKEKKFKTTNENKILIMLSFFSISIGLWGNFKQLWLEENAFSVSQISQILSFATLICSLVILLINKMIKSKNIKGFMVFAFILKILNLLFLYSVNGKGLTTLIDVSIVIDVIIEELIIICIYPFLCTIKKDDTLYSKRKLIEYFFKDFGILIGGAIVGKFAFGIFFDYNICLIIATVFLVIAFTILLTINQSTKDLEPENKEEDEEILKYLKKHKLIRIYMWYIIFGNIAMNVGLGLKMLMLTNIFSFSASVATNYLLIVGIIADIIGILALRYFTPKDDYFTVFLKFGIRMLLYIIAAISNNLIVYLIAITWSILISTAYENRIDGQYINTIPKELQLQFNNVTHIAKYISTAIGLFLAGITYEYGIQYMLGLSAFFMFFQITFSNTLIYMKHHPKAGD